MADEVKKISFGFSKLAKPKVSVISGNTKVKSEEDSVQYIDCVEDKSIKVKNEELKKPEFLVIPLPKEDPSIGKRKELLRKILNSANSNDNNEEIIETQPGKVDALRSDDKIETLDEKAAREIIEDLKKVKDNEKDQNNFTVPLTADETAGGKEATLDDYDSIPIDKFGLAMLRGMGWAPGKGIGKNEQVITAKQPVLRPKGLGLGADKVIKQDEKLSTAGEPLKLVKGSFVRIIAGVQKDKFGEVIGFDDETGRLIVKMALGGSVLTFNEFMVEIISKEDFSKNSKVINVKKYEEYKKNEDSQGVISKFKNNQDSQSKTKYVTKRSSSNCSRSSSDDREESFNRNTSSPERNTKQQKQNNRSQNSRQHQSYNSTVKLSKHHNSRESNKGSRYRSSSEDSTVARSKSRDYKNAASRESRKRRSSSSDTSPSRKYSSSKKDKSRGKYDRSPNSSTSSTDDYSSKRKYSSHSERKKKCKKNKEKKKSKRRNRSSSVEDDRHKSSSKKHKKSKYYD